MPVPERPTLVGLLIEVQRAAVAELLRRLGEAGFDDLRPSCAPVFQNIEEGGSRLTDLAERGQVTRQALTEQVEILERQGYVERVRDPSDGRARLVRLTERGWSAVRAGLAILDDLEREWGAIAGRRQVADTRRTLARVAAHASTAEE